MIIGPEDFQVRKRGLVMSKAECIGCQPTEWVLANIMH